MLSQLQILMPFPSKYEIGCYFHEDKISEIYYGSKNFIQFGEVDDYNGSFHSHPKRSSLYESCFKFSLYDIRLSIRNEESIIALGYLNHLGYFDLRKGRVKKMIKSYLSNPSEYQLGKIRDHINEYLIEC